jgi:hypothetical protein
MYCSKFVALFWKHWNSLQGSWVWGSWVALAPVGPLKQVSSPVLHCKMSYDHGSPHLLRICNKLNDSLLWQGPAMRPLSAAEATWCGSGGAAGPVLSKLRFPAGRACPAWRKQQRGTAPLWSQGTSRPWKCKTQIWHPRRLNISI